MRGSEESTRLKEARNPETTWQKWGPYLSERQWGTVREDYSVDGTAWEYFPYEQARSRAYRWGEDGLAGISDDQQRLCFAIVLWNGKDPFLKERAFGLTNGQGNHGEDVKEYYFYLENTPTHSYMKYLYKYPQQEFPYADLVAVNGKRLKTEPEYELLDTGIFDDRRYFDVFVEYAKAAPEDLLIKISVCNRGPDIATLRVLPTLWFRNTWAWEGSTASRPVLAGDNHVRASHPELGEYRLYFEGKPSLLYTENETNQKLLFGTPNAFPCVKDGINDFIVHGRPDAVNAKKVGTKMAADYALDVPPGETRCIRLRLTQKTYERSGSAFNHTFYETLEVRRAECDAFYRDLLPEALSDDERRVARQAFAGMLWTKQYYEYDVKSWLMEHELKGLKIRNGDWGHMANHDVISMPDKWEYPWYATWDSAFHSIALVLVDPEFAKEQLLLFLSNRYQHPDGQLPAYEWNFSDVNPPVHPFAVFAVYVIDKARRGDVGDTDFLKKAFHKLSLNFNWWLNKKDPSGKNAFEGGFLGLDNIGVFDRSSELPTGGTLEQSDGTAWMVLFAQYMMQISLELARNDTTCDEMVLHYLNHFISIAGGMDRPGENVDEMWDEDDGFFYDVLRFPDGTGTRLHVRSLVGLLPLCASTVIDPDLLDRLPMCKERYEWVVDRNKELIKNIARPETPGVHGRRLLAVLDEEKLRRILSRMLDENEFLSPHGIRSLSRFHAENPYTFNWNDEEYAVGYLPGESDTVMFGSNSNWRGPVWMPINFMILRVLRSLYTYYGDDFKVECPTGSGQLKTLFEVELELGRRLVSVFLKNNDGIRPVYGGCEPFKSDPHWYDYILFYEYFHGDNGRGMGASHQTGWTGLAATILVLEAALDPHTLLDGGIKASVNPLPNQSL